MKSIERAFAALTTEEQQTLLIQLQTVITTEPPAPAPVIHPLPDRQKDPQRQ